MASWESKKYFSRTECLIVNKPGCRFKFVNFLDINLRKLVNLDLDNEENLERPFLPEVHFVQLGPNLS